jgi:hypothetical protein
MVASLCIGKTTSGDPVVSQDPGGWTLIANRFIDSTAQFHWNTYYKVATSSDNVSHSWNFDDSYFSSIYILRFTGNNTTTPLDGTPSFSATATNGTHVAPSVDPAYTNDMWLVLAAEDNYGSWSPSGSPATSFTERHDGGASHAGMAATLLLSSGAATGTATFTTNSGAGQAVSILIKDASPTADGGSGVPVFMAHFRQLASA